MKKICCISLLFVSSFLFAQDPHTASQKGIYLSSQDYKNNKLSYAMDCDSSGKIRLNHFLAGSYIDVISGNKKIRLSKDSIFGFHDCDQKEYRFFKNNEQEFLIEESNAMIIYRFEIPVLSSTGKTSVMVPHYYFSVTPDSEILPLTVYNLKRSFPRNLQFHAFLDTEFAGVNNIAIYDAAHKMYKVNYLLNQTINK